MPKLFLKQIPSLILVLCMVQTTLFAQQTRPRPPRLNAEEVQQQVAAFKDSVAKAPTQAEKAKWLSRLASMETSYKLPERFEHHEEAIKLATESGDTPTILDSYIKASMSYRREGDQDKTFSLLKEGLSIAEKAKPSQQKGVYMSVLASQYRDQGMFDKALTYYQKALSVQEVLPENELKAGMANYDIGNLYMRMQDPSSALDYFMDALGEWEIAKEDQWIARAWRSIGAAYRRMGMPEEAEAANKKFEALQKKNPSNPVRRN
ncbi:MAG: tetratricopeptide repeat protein [Bacteroidota bacterium]